jgi:DNA-binding PadR family transcriptional regulator
MNDRLELWTLAQEAVRALIPFYRGPMQAVIEDAGLDGAWYTLLVARGVEPAPAAVESLHSMFPYGYSAPMAEMLERLARLEMLERVGVDAYRLTDLGRGALEDILGAAHAALEALEPLPGEEMSQLGDMLWRIVQAAVEAPEPREKGCLVRSRRTDPGAPTGSTVSVDQYVTDLQGFRDDCHLASWKAHGVSGHAWEAFTVVWRGEASSLEQLVEQLGSYRSYTAEDYREALQGLAARGWVDEQAGTYTLTETGKQVREEAEEVTDRVFFAPWTCLSEAETGRLRELLTELKGNLEKMNQDSSQDA